mgnify:CR=1 FL=1
MANIHVTPDAPDVGLRLDRVTPTGTEFGIEATGNDPVDVLCVQVPKIEVLCAMFLRDAYQALQALAAMVRIALPGQVTALHDHQLTSDHADSTVRIVLTKARDVLGEIDGIPTADDSHRAAVAMVKSLHDGLRAVNIDRNSAPGVRLIKVFLPCFHVVLSASKTPMQKNDALQTWKDERAKCLRMR